MNNGVGKGDKRRPFDQKTWGRNWVLIFGKDCDNCQGTGKVRTVKLRKAETVDGIISKNIVSRQEDCPFCNGLGRKEK